MLSIFLINMGIKTSVPIMMTTSMAGEDLKLNLISNMSPLSPALSFQLFSLCQDLLLGEACNDLRIGNCCQCYN